MSSYKVKPSKPMALFGALFGAAILVFGIVSMVGSRGSRGFLVLWVLAGLGIIGFNLWAAFSARGSVQTIVSSDGEPPSAKPGYRVQR